MGNWERTLISLAETELNPPSVRARIHPRTIINLCFIAAPPFGLMACKIRLFGEWWIPSLCFFGLTSFAWVSSVQKNPLIKEALL
jgi:hypothetical protein